MATAPTVIPLDAIAPGTHPGEVIRRYLSMRKLTQHVAASLLPMSRTNFTEMLAGHRGVTADSAITLGALFQTGADYWMTIQSRYDMHRARQRKSRREAE